MKKLGLAVLLVTVAICGCGVNEFPGTNPKIVAGQTTTNPASSSPTAATPITPLPTVAAPVTSSPAPGAPVSSSPTSGITVSSPTVTPPVVPVPPVVSVPPVAPPKVPITPIVPGTPGAPVTPFAPVFPVVPVAPKLPNSPALPITSGSSLTTLVLTGATQSVALGSTAQLSVTAGYSDSTSANVTPGATWSMTPTGVVTVSRDGLATCDEVGTVSITAFKDNTWSTAVPLTCTDPVVALRASRTFISSRVGSQVSVTLLASTQSGSNQDVTTLASFTSTSSVATVASSGSISCSQAGSTTIAASYAGFTQTIQVLCSPPSWNTPSFFLEQSAEFVGPFASWTNVQTAFGAKGDGITDDTAAIQRAFNSINSTGTGPVLWFPAGTYLISSTITLTHLYSFSLIGEDPQSTIFKWIGASGGTMLRSDASTYFTITRMTFDGAGRADTAEDLTDLGTAGPGYYATFNQISDEHIKGTSTGIKLTVAAETTIERVFFEGLTDYGITLGNFNTLDIFINDSLFTNCGTGVTNTTGAGNFIVTNSYFQGSGVADMSINNTGYFTARHNTSIGSAAFFVAGDVGENLAQVTAQNNTILDPSQVPFQIGNEGPLMLIDNVIRMQTLSLPVVRTNDTSSSTKILSIGNTYTTTLLPQTLGQANFNGVFETYDDSVVDPTTIPTVSIPSNVYVPPNLHRSIYDVASDGTGADIQNQINQAVIDNYSNPVIHIPSGYHHVMQPIVIPSGSNIQLIGDDATFAYLFWDGQGAGPLMQMNGANVTVKNLFIARENGSLVDGIMLPIDDQPSTNVMVDQSELQIYNSYSVNFDGVDHANAELFSTYTLGAVTGVNVTGGLYRATKQAALGITNLYSGGMQSEAQSTSFSVTKGGKFMVQDDWHDSGGTSPRNFILSGSGTVTEQVGVVAMNSNYPFEIDDFDGKVTLIGLSFVGDFISNPGQGHTDLLTIGLNGTDATYLPQPSEHLTTGSMMNYYWNNGAQQLPEQTPPDAQWLRSMLAQTRSEYPSKRLGMVGAGSRKRLERVTIKGFNSALHVLPNAVQSSFFYTLGQNGQMLSNNTASSASCLSTASEPTQTQAGWVLRDAGEGDYFLTTPNGSLILAATDSLAVGLQASNGQYSQRWMVQDVGDGRRQLRNRAYNEVLSWSAGSCVQLSSDAMSESSKWTLIAN